MIGSDAVTGKFKRRSVRKKFTWRNFSNISAMTSYGLTSGGDWEAASISIDTIPPDIGLS
jgi:hypothetical protein